MKLLMVFSSLLLSTAALCQTGPDTLGNIYDDIDVRNKGVVYLKNGDHVSGYVDYSTYTNVLRVTTEDPVPASLTPRNVAKFEFFDQSQKLQRIFISHEFSYPKYDIESSTVFFEVLTKNDGITLLERSCPISINTKVSRPNSGMGYYPNSSSYTQKALVMTDQLVIICFFANDKIEPYMVYRTKEVDNLSGRGLRGNNGTTSSKVVDKHLPERLLGNKFQEARKYAKANRLNWTRESELALIIDHYNSVK